MNLRVCNIDLGNEEVSRQSMLWLCNITGVLIIHGSSLSLETLSCRFSGWRLGDGDTSVVHSL